ncbi:MAG: hypothetical protein JWQ22_3063 [Devosia sp.]|nr:hypothetical protein [Devosia sp.]
MTSTEFRVIDLGSGAEGKEETILSRSPEEAARRMLGEAVVRSGARRDLRAKVYWQYPGQPLSMVRLYSKVENSVV